MTRTEYQRIWREQNPDKSKEYNKKQYSLMKNKNYYKDYYKRKRSLCYGQHLKRKYNIDYTDYLKLVEKQQNLCRICEKPPKEGQYLAVDHCHKTGLVRSLLCINCNTALGAFRENEELLFRAIRYLGIQYV